MWIDQIVIQEAWCSKRFSGVVAGAAATEPGTNNARRDLAAGGLARKLSSSRLGRSSSVFPIHLQPSDAFCFASLAQSLLIGFFSALSI
jgi:hypothetical protein